MINLIFITLAFFGLIFLFLQHKLNNQQEDLIKSETKALKRLKKFNKSRLMNRQVVQMEKSNSPSNIFRPLALHTSQIPEGRSFEFPRSFKRRSNSSVMSN